mgnify:CR=1 FL=1
MNLKEKIVALAKLRSGWSGSLSVPPTFRAIDNTGRVAALLDVNQLTDIRLAPNTEGSITLCYTLDGKRYEWDFFNGGDITLSTVNALAITEFICVEEEKLEDYV